jgi:RNA polymerase sigma factor (sigma-70 family)
MSEYRSDDKDQTQKSKEVEIPFDRSFDSVFEQYADVLFRHAFFRVSNREVAYDLAQDAFIKAWQYSQDNEIREWKSILFATLNNLIIDYYRKKKPVSLSEIEENAAEFGTELPDALHIGGKAVEEGRLDVEFSVRELAKAMEQISESNRTLLTKRYIDDISVELLAEELGILPDSVYVRIHRALKELKTKFRPEKQ